MLRIWIDTPEDCFNRRDIRKIPWSCFLCPTVYLLTNFLDSMKNSNTTDLNNTIQALWLFKLMLSVLSLLVFNCSSAYPHPHLLKFAKVNYHIKFFLKLLEVLAICLFKLLIIINIEWKTKILRRERETSEEKIINKRGKTDGSTN